MADFASMMGGGSDTVATAGADPNGAFVYNFDQGDVFLDLGGQGDHFFGTGNLGSATIFGGSGADSLFGGSAEDFLFGGKDDDAVFGADGGDFLSGDGGADTLAGESGDDTLFAGTGNDVVDAGEGEDFVQAGEGDDTIVGLEGDDTIYAGGGNDSVEGGEGDDFLVGGSGADGFYYFDGFGQDVISDLQPGDSIHLQANINGFDISSPADLLSTEGVLVEGGNEGGVSYTLISIGSDTIRLQNVDVEDFTANISSFVKIG